MSNTTQPGKDAPPTITTDDATAAITLAVLDLALLLHDKGILDARLISSRWKETSNREDLVLAPATRRAMKVLSGVLDAVDGKVDG